MAYSKTSNKNQDKDVKYLSKDYNSFKNQLINFTKTYFPDNFNDFSEGNPGMMFLEMAAYVGDVLSFYTDNQLRESFLNLAQDKTNIYNLAYSMGYKPKITSAASVDLEISQLIPSKPGTDPTKPYEPDYQYALNINKNSTFVTQNKTSFYTTKDVRFDFSSSFEPTTISIYQYDTSNNPEYYLLTKTVPAVSGDNKSESFIIGASEKFKTINLFDSDIISIESITDSDNNKWTEVPYMAQDTVFEEVQNLGTNDPTLQQYNHQTPYLLKIKRTPKRFTTRIKADNSIDIQFGAGTSDKSDEQIIPNPDNIGLGIKDGRSKLDTAYDPSNFLHTRAYGEAPSNTTLVVNYIVGGGLKANVNSNTITSIGTLSTTNKPNVNASMVNFAKSSIVCTNPQAARGGGAGESLEEIRMNTMANFSAQQRTVTKDDYLIRTLSMPSQLGRVTKAYITQDDQISPLTTEPNRIPNPLALNLYTLGYDNNKKIANLNDATKNNLATYLEQYRMLTDAINIKNAFPINFQIEFEITAFKNYNNQLVLLECITELKSYFQIDKWQINQPIIISEIQNLIGSVEGVQTIESLTFSNVSGETKGYSPYSYSFTSATRNGVIYPSMDPSIFELKYPNTDINGRVTTY
tara:strand:+ start:4220 stop:6121 length:1902 start_codon:yes stop_codon:yes gene_type:complete